MKNSIIAAFVLLLIAGGIFVVSKNSASAKHYHVGIIVLTDVDEMTLRGFKEKLSELGYVEGRNITYHFDGPVVNMEKNFQKRVVNLKQYPLDLVFVSSTPTSVAIKAAFEGSGVPILFCPVSDPVAAGLVDNLKRPGGNITGVKLVSAEEQRLKWLTQVVPGVRSVYLPYTLEDKSALSTLEQVTPAAKALGLSLYPKSFEEGVNEEEILSGADNADAIFMPRDSRMENRIGAFVAYAQKHNLPLSAPSFVQVQNGALFSYGHVHYDLGRQAGRMAHQIFSGVKAGEIPVELAENQFVLNVATARKISLNVPGYVVKQADQVIKE
jgi:putative tryptophan/tyrosine transport system substrate-binding protein